MSIKDFRETLKDQTVKDMKGHIHTTLLSLLLLATFLGLGSGCATLPNVSDKISRVPAANKPDPILSDKGLLPPQKSKEVMARMKQSVRPTDMLARHNALMESITKTPLTKGNKVTLIIDGKMAYATMFREIEAARDHINLETFILEDDDAGRKFTKLLLKKQAEGVQVNLIYDAVGSYKTPAAFFKRLRDAGIQVTQFNPINPLKTHGHWLLKHPDHRKILIVDGKIAISGGINISSDYTVQLSGGNENGAPLPWRDTDVRVEGPMVAEFQNLFMTTWQTQKGPKLTGRNYFPALKAEGEALGRVVGSTPGHDNRITFIVYVSAITFAEHSIHLTNAYLILDHQIMDAFTDAAKRGVDVKIIVPKTSDSSKAIDAAHYNYARLLKAGVKIYERRNAILHAKTAVIDGVWSTVGSTNLDFWSLLSDDEVNSIVLGKGFAIDMERMFATDLAESDQILWETWKHRPWFDRMKESAAHLFYQFM